MVNFNRKNKKLVKNPRNNLLITVTANNDIDNIYSVIQTYIKTNNVIPKLIAYVIEKTAQGVEHIHIGICSDGINPSKFNNYLKDKVKTFCDVTIHKSHTTWISYINKIHNSITLYTDNTIDIQKSIDKAYINKKRVVELFKQETDRLHSLLIKHATGNKNTVLKRILEETLTFDELLKSNDSLVINYLFNHSVDKLYTLWMSFQLANGRRPAPPFELLTKDYDGISKPYSPEEIGDQRYGLINVFKGMFGLKKNISKQEIINIVQNNYQNLIIVGKTGIGKTTIMNKLKEILPGEFFYLVNGFMSRLMNPFCNFLVLDDPGKLSTQEIAILKLLANPEAMINMKGGQQFFPFRIPIIILTNDINLLSYGSEYNQRVHKPAIDRRYRIIEMKQEKEPSINWDMDWNLQRLRATLLSECVAV